MITFFTKKNFAKGTLASAIPAVATQVILNAGHNLPTTGSFRAIIWNNVTYSYPPDDPNMEIVTAVLNAGDTYDITRAQEGTPASTHAASDRMALHFTAGQSAELETEINVKASLTGTETLTNKILTYPIVSNVSLPTADST